MSLYLCVCVIFSATVFPTGLATVSPTYCSVSGSSLKNIDSFSKYLPQREHRRRPSFTKIWVAIELVLLPPSPGLNLRPTLESASLSATSSGSGSNKAKHLQLVKLHKTAVAAFTAALVQMSTSSRECWTMFPDIEPMFERRLSAWLDCPSH